MKNITSTPAFTNNYQIHQQQLPNQSPAPMAGDNGDIEKTLGSNTNINKNQGRGTVSRQLQQTSDSIHSVSNYAVQTTVNGASSIKERLNALAEKKKADPKVQIALVSGGSTAGFAAALKLKNCGFHVIVAEKRTAYTRQNTFVLKEEALFSLTNLSPKGKLLKYLLDNKLMDINKYNIVKEGGLFGPDGGNVVKVANPAFRFVNWLTNNDNIHSSAKIPVRVKKDRETTEYLDLQKASAEKQREPLGYLDPAWPEHEAVIPVDPQDWKYSDLGKISQHNVGLCQIRNLEKGLNQYCLNQENIEIISAEVEVKKTDPEDEKYSVTFTVADKNKKESIDSPFHFDRIIIAEGANSTNAAAISEQTIIPKVESWYQANYFEPESGSPGLFGALVDKNKKQMTAIHHIGRQEGALVNMSLGVEPDKQFDPDSIQKAMKNSKHMCDVGGANVKISEETREFTSQRIDVDIKRANPVIRSNVVLVGDSAGSGSPVGALGGSLALAAYPQVVENWVKHPDLKNPEKRSGVERFYREQTARVVNLRHGIPSDTMRKLGYYPAAINKQRIKNDTLALFPDVADAQHASNAQDVSP